MYKSIDEIKIANKNLGHHFFEANSWLLEVAEPKVYSGKYFITKDFLKIGSISVPAKYTIRRADDDGGISTVGKYCEFDTLKDARKKIKEME